MSDIRARPVDAAHVLAAIESASTGAIESAKKAVEVFEKGRSLDDVVEELRAEQSAEPELARPMVQTGVQFLRRWSPRRGFALLAMTTLICPSTLKLAFMWLRMVTSQRMEWH